MLVSQAVASLLKIRRRGCGVRRVGALTPCARHEMEPNRRWIGGASRKFGRAPAGPVAIVAAVLALAPQRCSPVSAQACAAGAVLSGTEVADVLRSQTKVLCDDVTVQGEIDIAALDTITGPVILTNSRIDNSFMAPFVTFEGPVDFSGTTFGGAVDVRGSLFQGDSRWADATVSADFNASGARFTRALDFGDARALSTASFQRATFEDVAFLERAEFNGEGHFERASFSTSAEFSRASFSTDAYFDDMTVAENADFSLGRFSGTAFFRRISVGGTLDFFEGEFTSDAILDGVSAHALNLSSSRFGRSLAMNGSALDSLRMDLDDIDRLPADQQRIDVLHQIEKTARDGGRTEVANDASFRRQTITNDQRKPVYRAVVYVFGEQIAGYLVRPLRPVRAMLFVAAIGVIVRLETARRHDRRQRRSTSRGKRLLRGSTAFFQSLGAAVSVAIIPKPPKLSLEPDQHEDLATLVPAGARWAEYLAQKALNAVFVIAIGNTIPGAKDVIDSILSL